MAAFRLQANIIRIRFLHKFNYYCWLSTPYWQVSKSDVALSRLDHIIDPFDRLLFQQHRDCDNATGSSPCCDTCPGAWLNAAMLYSLLLLSVPIHYSFAPSAVLSGCPLGLIYFVLLRTVKTLLCVWSRSHWDAFLRTPFETTWRRWFQSVLQKSDVE